MANRIAPTPVAPSVTLSTAPITGSQIVSNTPRSDVPVVNYVPIHVQSQFVTQQLDELRSSHASLSTELGRIRQDLNSARRNISISRTHAIHDKLSFESRALRRVLLFASENARKTLVVGSKELTRSCRNLCAGTAVKQVLLKTKSADCTFLEFQLLASSLSASTEYRCSIFPSEYYARFCNPDKATRFEIIFPTYFDYCSALNIDVDTREAGLYIERGTARKTVRAIQILGVDVLADSRRVLVGCGMPKSPSDERVPVLHQESTNWTSGTADSGVLYRTEVLQSIFNSRARITTSVPVVEQAGERKKRSSRLHEEPDELWTFSLAWKRIPAARSGFETTPETIAGHLYSKLPAVVLRGNVLTRTAQIAFSSLINGKYLKEIVVSPPSI